MGTNDSTQACTNARNCAPHHPTRHLRTPTATTNVRKPKIRATHPLGSLPWPRDGAHGRSREHALGRQRCGDGKRRGGSGDGGNDVGGDVGGGGVEERGFACASRAQTHVSVLRAHKQLFEPRHAHVGGRGRAHLGACRRSCRSGRPFEPTGEGGTHPWDGQGRMLENPPLPGSACGAQVAPITL